MTIYKITNLVNNKIYIGQTIRPLSERWREHRSVNSDTLIHRAIVKYGEKQFTIEEIDTANNKVELDEKEIYWISFYNSMTPNGYNICLGGSGVNKGYLPVYQYDLTGQLIKRWTSREAAGLSLKLSPKNISAVCTGKRKSAGGFIWSYEEKEISEWTNDKTKTIYQFDLNGTFIRSWESARQASLSLGISASSIIMCCNSKYSIHRAGEYQWSYDPTFTCKYVKVQGRKTTKKVLCVELNKIYDSIKDACNDTGAISTKIALCCTGRRERTGGYHWKYVNEQEIG